MLRGWKYSVTVMLRIIYASDPQAHVSSRTHWKLSYCLSGKWTSREPGDSAMMRSQVLTSSTLECAQSLGSAIPPNPPLSTALCLSRAGQSPRSSCWCRGGWGRLQTSPGSGQVQGGRTDRTHFKQWAPALQLAQTKPQSCWHCFLLASSQ